MSKLSTNSFVTFGNLKTKFNRMCEAVLSNINLLPNLIIQAGPNYNFFQELNISCCQYLSKNYFDQLIGSSIVISHGGIGSIIEANKRGIYPCVFPRTSEFGEHADDHQVEFCEKYRDSGYFFYAKNSLDLTNFLTNSINKTEPEKIDFNSIGISIFLDIYMSQST